MKRYGGVLIKLCNRQQGHIWAIGWTTGFCMLIPVLDNSNFQQNAAFDMPTKTNLKKHLYLYHELLQRLPFSEGYKYE